MATGEIKGGQVNTVSMRYIFLLVIGERVGIWECFQFLSTMRYNLG